MSYKVEQLPIPLLYLGEGPHWDITTQSLYLVNIFDKGEILRYDYKENKTYRATIDHEDFVSFIIPVEGQKDKYAVGIKGRVGIIHWDGKSTTTKVEKIVFEVDKGKQTRLNDGKADPKGRLVAGTMRLEGTGDVWVDRLGTLYLFSKTDAVQVLRENIGISNGLAWNEKTNKCYYIDTTDKNIKEFNYDINTGKVDTKNPKVIIDFGDQGNRLGYLPDGMTIDRDGNLYVATFGASKVLKINPTRGTIDLEINLPCENITSVAFGGPNLDILYITTSSLQGKPDPAGATYKVTGLGVVGTKMYNVRL